MASSKKKYAGPCDYEHCERPKDDTSCRFRPAAKPELQGKQVCPNAKCQYWGGNRDEQAEKAKAAESAAAKKAEKEAAKAAEKAAKEAAAAAAAAALASSSLVGKQESSSLATAPTAVSTRVVKGCSCSGAGNGGSGGSAYSRRWARRTPANLGGSPGWRACHGGSPCEKTCG